MTANRARCSYACTSRLVRGRVRVRVRARGRARVRVRVRVRARARVRVMARARRPTRRVCSGAAVKYSSTPIVIYSKYSSTAEVGIVQP